MAFTETSVIAEITVLPAEATAQVKWRNTIEKDGEVISSKDHYKLYPESQKSEFLAEVEGAESYIAALGWQ